MDARRDPGKADDLREEAELTARAEKILTGLLAVAALLAGLNYFYISRSHGSWIHRWDLFHTVMSARYFEEVGYSRLYESAYVIDAKSNRQYADVRRIRDLETLRYVSTKNLARESDSESRFTPARKEAFAEDLRFWNGINTKDRWKRLFLDKGYNGTPFFTMLARVAFGEGPLTTRRLHLAALVDIALILLAFAVVARTFGIRIALLAFLFFCSSFPNSFAHMGGSFLRFGYLSFLVIGVCMIRQGRFGLAGALFAVAGMERVFPFLFVAGFGIKGVYDSLVAGRIDARYRRFFTAFALTVALCFGLSVLAIGFDSWGAFLDNMKLHNRNTAGYRIGFRHMFMLTGNLTGPDGFVSFPEKTEHFRSLLVPYLSSIATFAVVLALLLRRLNALQYTIVFGLLTFFLFFNATRYYYSILVLLFLMGTDVRRQPWYAASCVILFLISFAAHGARRFIDFDPFLYNTLFSYLLLAYFLYLSFALLVRDGSKDRSGGRLPGRFLVPILAVPILAIAGGALFATAGNRRGDNGRPILPGEGAPAAESSLLSRPDSLQVVAGTLKALLLDPDAAAERPAGGILGESCLGTYFNLREGGRAQASIWTPEGKLYESLLLGARSLRESAVSRSGDEPLTVEMCIVLGSSPVDRRRPRGAFGNVYRGTRGLELELGDEMTRLAPTEMIARNLSFERAIEEYVSNRRISRQTLESGGLNTRTLDCVQLLIFLNGDTDAVRMFRGNEIVTMAGVTPEAVRDLERLAGDWLVRQVRDDGRITYKYWPSRGEESTANNMIRQWMATVALTRLGLARGDRSILDLAERNIRYNLSRFYREEDGLGVIEWNGKVKLGAAAVAALAIVEHPARERFRKYEEGLMRTVEYLRREDGSFATFYKPPTRNDNQNFYPGEALVLLATLSRETGDPERLRAIRESFEYYREWHLENRNPAFVPWHTQAYYKVWRETGDEEMKDFIFLMNDWLLGMQQWDGALYPDMKGRFFDPDRSGFGPPHASSTGVYLEGLIDAWALAKATGDSARAEAYRIAILRGLRSVMQLQFADDVDLFYVSQKDRTLGGIRTTVYDNTIRVDNVQHNLMAILKVIDAFGVEDYAAAP